MKFIVVALIMDFLYVKFDVLKWKSDDDVIYWILNGIIALPLYIKGYLILYKKKRISVILSLISFIVFGIFSAILMLLFHTEILNAPL
ncbi:MAG: hypothetical protein Q4B88_05750 [Moraxella sp.]|nr:hypothetical protein [Moraxella sp.]